MLQDSIRRLTMSGAALYQRNARRHQSDGRRNVSLLSRGKLTFIISRLQPTRAFSLDRTHCRQNCWIDANVCLFVCLSLPLHYDPYSQVDTSLQRLAAISNHLMSSLADIVSCPSAAAKQGAFKCFASLGANDEDIRWAWWVGASGGWGYQGLVLQRASYKCKLITLTVKIHSYQFSEYIFKSVKSETCSFVKQGPDIRISPLIFELSIQYWKHLKR